MSGSRPTARRGVRLSAAAGVVLVVVSAALMLAPGVASAHALLASSSPKDGAIVAQAPQIVTMTFTEAPDPSLSSAQILDPAGKVVSAGKVEPVTGDKDSLRLAMRPVGNGVYTVAWRTVSEVDGHYAANSFTFGVGVSPAGAPSAHVPAPVTPNPTAASIAGRWMLFVGLAILVAAGTMQGLVIRGPLPGARLLLPAAWILAAAGLAVGLLAQANTAGVSLGSLLSSTTGAPLVREGIALVVLGVVVAVAVVRLDYWSVVVVGVTAVVVLLFHTFTGHANAAGTWHWFNLFVQWAHVVSVGVWIGGLVWLLADVARGVEGHEEDVRRYSGVASVALFVVLGTGTLRAIDLLGGWGHLGRLISTGWGTALLWKLGLFVVLAGLGAWNRFVNVRDIEHRGARGLRRIVVCEVVVAAAIFGVTGVLAGLAPAAYAAQTSTPPAPSSLVVRGADFATTTRATMTLTPGTAGANHVSLRVTDYDTGAPIDATSVTMRLTPEDRPEVGTSNLALKKNGATWQADSTGFALQATYDVVVTVQTASTGTEIPMKVTPRTAPATPTSTASVSPSESCIPGQNGVPTICTTTLSDGNSVQTYVESSKPGLYNIHFTAFDTKGNELPITSAKATATSPQGAAEELSLKRLSAGHFVGTRKLSSGTWTFALNATANDGSAVQMSFTQEIK